MMYTTTITKTHTQLGSDPLQVQISKQEGNNSNCHFLSLFFCLFVFVLMWYTVTLPTCSYYHAFIPPTLKQAWLQAVSSGTQQIILIISHFITTPSPFPLCCMTLEQATVISMSLSASTCKIKLIVLEECIKGLTLSFTFQPQCCWM